MLFESVKFIDNLPFSVHFTNVLEENYHCHKEMEMLFVLKGRTKYKIHNVHYDLSAGDIIIADVEDLHQIYGSSKDICMLQMHIDMKFFEKYHPDISYMFFVCEECTKDSSSDSNDLQNKLSFLRKNLARIMVSYCRDNDDPSLLMQEIKELIDILVSNFRGFYMEDFQYKPDSSEISPIDLERLCRINKYLLNNYDKKITLGDVAEMEHLNPYYVSHLIKNISGTGFQSFLNSLRVEFAEMMLIDTSENLTHISQACGFSSPNYFNKCFKTLHGKTPAQYRKSFVQRTRIYGKPLSEKKALDLLKTYLPLSDKVFFNDRSFEAVLHADFMRTSGEDFSGLFRRRLIIDSHDDLLKLKGLERQIGYLNFSSVALSYDFMNDIKNSNSLKDAESYLLSFGLPVEKLTSSLSPYMQTYNEKVRPADTAAMIFKTAYPGVFLSGRKNSLFAPGAVATPYYFTFFALADVSGTVTVSHERGMVIKENDSLFMILFNEDEKRTLKYRINIKNLPGKCCMVSKHFCGQDNQYDIPLDTGSLKIIPERLRIHLNSAFCGNTSFSSLISAKDMPFIFELSPGSLAVVEIIKMDI